MPNETVKISTDDALTLCHMKDPPPTDSTPFSCVYSLQPPLCKANVFVSSSTADCKVEREILFNIILPRLRADHIDDGIEISIADMRWGLVDNQSDSHQSWSDCAAEIKRCHEQSAGGFFFLSLQADKYGYATLPWRLDRDDFEQCLAENKHMYENKSVMIGKGIAGKGLENDDNIQDVIQKLKEKDSNRSLAAIAKLWYDELDENSNPQAYVLRNITEENRQDWLEDKVCLLKFFEKVSCYRHLLRDCDCGVSEFVVNRSVSEFEVKYAFSLVGRDDGRKLLWMKRNFAHKGNIYSYDKSSAMKIKNLKAWMVGELSSRGSGDNCGMHELVVNFEEYIARSGASYDQYVDSWSQSVYEKYSKSIKETLNKVRCWWQEHCDSLNISRKDLEEIIYHNNFTQQQCEMFVGRREMMTLVLKTVEEWTMPCELTIRNRVAGVCVSIVGRAGMGKSSLIAALSLELREQERKKMLNGSMSSPVVTRYCGLTVESTDGLALVVSICVEIHGHLNMTNQKVPDYYEGAVKCLHGLLKEHSILLLIDGLDTITHAHRAGGNMLSFLANLKPHEGTRIIVSTRMDEKDKTSQSLRWKMCYGCDSRLQESHVTRIQLKAFADKTSEYSVDPKSEPLLLVNRFIEVQCGKNGRVTPATTHINKLLKRLAMADRRPSPLTVTLASRLLLLQSTSAPFHIEKTDGALISQSFRLLELHFGKRIALLAFSFITFSVGGVTDEEIVDLLSLDHEYNASVADHRSCSRQRVAAHLWQRLKREVGILLRENKEGRLEWTHRTVLTYAKHKYSEEKFTKMYIHQLMGRYFCDTIEPRIRDERRITPQPATLTEIPVWFHNSSINKRRFQEGLHHLIEGGLLAEACTEVCCLEHICAYFKCGLRVELVTNIIKLHRAVVQSGEAQRTVFHFSGSYFKRLDSYMRWIRQAICDAVEFTPETGIFTSSSATQPHYSDVLLDGFQCRDAAYCVSSFAAALRSKFAVAQIAPRPVLSEFSRCSWNRGVCLGENIQFQSLVSTFRHHYPVKCVDWLLAKDDSKVLSVANNEMLIWDTNTAQIVDSFMVNVEIVCATVNSDATILACGSRDRSIRLFDITSGIEISPLQGHAGMVTCLCFSLCNELLCSGSMDCSVLIWQDGAVVKSFEGHFFEVTQAMFSPDSRKVVSGSLDKTVKIWDVSSGDLLFSLEQVSYVHSVVFNPIGSTIAIGSADGMIRILNMSYAGFWSEVPGGMSSMVGSMSDGICALGGHQGAVLSVAFSPNGSHLASGGRDHYLSIWHVSTGCLVASLNVHVEAINFVKFSFDSQKVVTASNDKTVRIFDVATEFLAPVEKNFDSLFEERKKSVNSVSFSPDGLKIVSTSGCEVFVWDVTRRCLLTTLREHDDTVTSSSFNTSSSKLCSCDIGGEVRVWDALTYEVLATLKSPGVASVAFTLDGYKVVMRYIDYRVSFWDYFGGEIVHKFCNERQVYRPYPYQVNLVTFSPEGLLKTISVVNAKIAVNGLLIDSDITQEIQLWDVVSQECISTLERYSPSCTHQGEYLDGEQVMEQVKENGNDAIENNGSSDGDSCSVQSRAFSFSPDGLSIAVGFTDGAIVVSDILRGTTKTTLLGHTALVTSLCFNIEGSRVVSGSEDYSVKIWDLQGEELVCTLNGHSGRVVHVTYSPCGLMVASASEDKTLILWDAVQMQGPKMSCSEGECDDWNDVAAGDDVFSSTTFVSQMSAVIGSVEEAVDPDDAFLTADEKRIKSYRFQYIDGW